MDTDDTDITVYMVSRLPRSSESPQELKQETNDTMLTKLKKVIMDGWPSNKSNIDPQVKPWLSGLVHRTLVLMAESS